MIEQIKNNSELIKKFYISFSDRNVKGMIECYHEEIVFIDPIFGRLEGERAVKMWEMLLSKKDKDTKISFNNVISSSKKGEAHCIAEYLYGNNNRKVVNKIIANFKFKDDKIIEHTDSFDLWKWTRQAMGLGGYLIGWSSFTRKNIQKTANKKLDVFIKQ